MLSEPNADNKYQEEVRKYIQQQINDNFSSPNNIKAITIGCSHTNYLKLPEIERWHGIFHKNTGMRFLVGARHATGLFYLNKLEIDIIPQMLDVNSIQHIVIQRPLFLRYPWYCNKEGSVPPIASVKRFFEMIDCETQQKLLKKIRHIETKILKNIMATFPNAAYSTWRYWIDDFSIIGQEYNEEMDRISAGLGIDSFGTIVPIKIDRQIHRQINNMAKSDNINHILQNHFACLFSYYKDWLIEPKKDHQDLHGTKKHNEFIAQRVEKWIFGPQ